MLKDAKHGNVFLTAYNNIINTLYKYIYNPKILHIDIQIQSFLLFEYNYFCWMYEITIINFFLNRNPLLYDFLCLIL